MKLIIVDDTNGTLGALNSDQIPPIGTKIELLGIGSRGTYEVVDHRYALATGSRDWNSIALVVEKK